MLSQRIARYAARHGLSLPRSVQGAYLGMEGTIRCETPIALGFTNAAHRHLLALGNLDLIQHLQMNRTWISLYWPKNMSFETFAATVSDRQWPESCKVKLMTTALSVSLVPFSDHCLGVTYVGRNEWEPRGLLVLGSFTQTAPARDQYPLLDLLVAREQTQVISKSQNLRQNDNDDEHFLRPYRFYLDNLKRFLKNSTPTAPYKVVSSDPFGLSTEGFWPNLFTRVETQFVLPRTDGRGRVRARVVEVDDGQEIVTLSSHSDLSQIANEGTLSIAPAVAPIERMLEALGELANSSDRFHLKLFDVLRRAEAFSPVSSKHFVSKTLGVRDIENQRQHDAVSMALGCEDLCLIHGPPGTGKTTVICELVLHLIEQGQRVLLVAPTHVALDNVLERIGNAPGVCALRLGQLDNVDPRVKDFHISEIGRSLAKKLQKDLSEALYQAPLGDPVVAVQKEWSKALGDRKRSIGNLLLLNANVICATPIGIAMAQEFRRAEPIFDVLIMDESSKATLTEFLVPATRAKRWILVGDHKQLAPYIDQEELASVIERRGQELFPDMLPDVEEIAQRLKQTFEQRQHPEPEIRKRSWDDLVQIHLEDSPSLLETFQELEPTEQSLRKLSRTFAKGSLGATTATWLRELLEIRSSAMPSAFEFFAEQLEKQPSRVVKLNVQHRMAPSLAEFSKDNVYSDDYHSAGHTKNKTLTIPTLESHSIWIDTGQAPKGQRFEHPRDQNWTGGGYYNPLEANICLEVLEKILSWAQKSWHGDEKSPNRTLEIGIVSFYLEQARRLRRKLSKYKTEPFSWRGPAKFRAANGAEIDIHVSVVDRFQGQEKDIIVLSGTRSNPKRRRGHVDNLNRLNVAVTRARYKRIIVGDSTTLVWKSDKDLLKALFQGSERKIRWGHSLKAGRKS